MAGEVERRGVPVILDSNCLFIPLQFGVDVFKELQRLLEGSVRYLVPRTVIEELLLLRKDAKPSAKKRIDFALSHAEGCEEVEVNVETGETVDDSIIRLAVQLRCPVATNDAELRRRLRAEMIPVIYLREKSHLEMDGTI